VCAHVLAALLHGCLRASELLWPEAVPSIAAKMRQLGLNPDDRNQKTDNPAGALNHARRGGGGSCRKRCIAGYSRLRLVSWQALAGNLALRGWCWDCRCLVRRSQQAHRTFHVAGIANVVVKAAAEDMKSNGLNSAGSEHAFNAQPYRWGGTALGEGSRVGLGRQGGVGGAGWGWVGRTQGPDAAVA